MPTTQNADNSVPEREFCYRVLDFARQKAAKASAYNSAQYRLSTSNAYEERFHRPPYEYQVDIGEAVELGLDCILTAGTGAGKTHSFIMPLLKHMNSKKMVLVVSPLNELQRDQAESFIRDGIPATPVNGSIWSDELEKRIKNLDFRVLLTSPEMMFTKTAFSKLIHDPEFMSNVVLIVADEAHTVTQWSGKSFRPLFGELGKLRSLVKLDVPILAASATMTPEIVDGVKKILGFRTRQTFELNLGNSRKNITPVVVKIKSETDFDALRVLIDGAKEGEPLTRTLVYVLKKDLAQDICLYLRDLLPANSPLRSQIDFAHSGRDPSARSKAIQDFKKGVVNVLIATEVAGMGLDLRDIVRIFQFGVPETLCESVQHGGRAGRDGRPAYYVVLAPKSFFRVPKKQAAESADKLPNQDAQPSSAQDGLVNTAAQPPHAENASAGETNLMDVQPTEPSVDVSLASSSSTVLQSAPNPAHDRSGDSSSSEDDDDDADQSDLEEEEHEEFELEDPFEVVPLLRLYCLRCRLQL